MQLGQILLRKRLIDRDQLNEALRRQARSGRGLGEILLGMGVASRDDIVAALLSQPDGCADETILTRVREATARRLPPELSRRYRCIVLLSREQWVCVAMADPLDVEARSALESELGVPVVAVAGEARALDAAWQRVYGVPGTVRG